MICIRERGKRFAYKRKKIDLHMRHLRWNITAMRNSQVVRNPQIDGGGDWRGEGCAGGKEGEEE